MANETGQTPAGIPGRSNRWGQLLNVVLLTGCAAATLGALTVLVAVFWWLYAPSGNTPETVAVRPPVPQAPVAVAPAAQHPVAAAPAPAAAARPAAPAARAQQPAAAPGAESAARPAPAGPGRRGYKTTNDRDAEMTGGIARGLHQLAQDPAAMRQLGAPGEGPKE